MQHEQAIWSCTDTQATDQPGSVAFFLTLHTWNEYPFSILQPFHLQLYHHQSTTPPTTGISWYKQPSLSWLIKTIWTWVVRVATERESQQPAYLPGHQAFSIIEQCINRIKSILAFDDLHMNTSGLVYTVLFFLFNFWCHSCETRLESRFYLVKFNGGRALANGTTLSAPKYSTHSRVSF